MKSASDLAKRYRDAAIAHAPDVGGQPVVLIVVVATADEAERPGLLTRVSMATSNNFGFMHDSEDVREILELAIGMTRDQEPTRSGPPPAGGMRQ